MSFLSDLALLLIFTGGLCVLIALGGWLTERLDDLARYHRPRPMATRWRQRT